MTHKIGNTSDGVSYDTSLTLSLQMSCPSLILIAAHIYTIIIMKSMSCVLIHDEAFIINYPVAT